MPKIKWLGIFHEEIAVHQRGNLLPGAVKLTTPSTEAMMLKALPMILPSVAVVFVCMLGKTMFTRQPPQMLAVLAGVVLGIVALPLHELLHAVVYPRGAVVSVGVSVKASAVVALCSYPLRRWRFVMMSLSPLLLGVVPMAAYLLMPGESRVVSGLLFGMGAFGLCSPYADFYNVVTVLRQTPKGCMVQFEGDDLYWMPPEASGKEQQA